MLHYLPCRAAAINSSRELQNPSGMGMAGINTRLDGPPGPFAYAVPHFLYSLLFTFIFFWDLGGV